MVYGVLQVVVSVPVVIFVAPYSKVYRLSRLSSDCALFRVLQFATVCILGDGGETSSIGHQIYWLSRLASDCTMFRVLQVAFSVRVVNLAAPYASLTALSADKALQKALRKAGVGYVVKTLQVHMNHI